MRTGRFCDTYSLTQNFQRTGGTVLRTLPAYGADGGGRRIPELGLDDRGEAAAHKAQQAHARHLITDAHAQVAGDALALIPLDDGQAVLLEAGVLLSGKAVWLHIVLIGVFHQLALAIVVAAALKAALGLRAGLLLGEAEAHSAEVLPALLAAALGGLGPGQLLPLGQLGLQRIVLLAPEIKGTWPETVSPFR